MKDLSERRLIAVTTYGSDGRLPADFDAYRCIHRGEVSCVGSSGDSFCGGFMGLLKTKDRTYCMCNERDPLETEYE